MDFTENDTKFHKILDNSTPTNEDEIMKETEFAHAPSRTQATRSDMQNTAHTRVAVEDVGVRGGGCDDIRVLQNRDSIFFISRTRTFWAKIKQCKRVFLTPQNIGSWDYRRKVHIAVSAHAGLQFQPGSAPPLPSP